MVLLLETAAVLEARAHRTYDAAQVAVLLRRAGQRRQQADCLREELASRGAALPAHQVQRLRRPAVPGPAARPPESYRP